MEPISFTLAVNLLVRFNGVGRTFIQRVQGESTKVVTLKMDMARWGEMDVARGGEIDVARGYIATCWEHLVTKQQWF